MAASMRMLSLVSRHGLRPIATISRTVNGNEIDICCGNTARTRAKSFGASSSMLLPLRVTEPDVSGKSPATAPSNVDFPAPLGPSTATSSPALTSSETSFKSVVDPRTTTRFLATSAAVMPSPLGCGEYYAGAVKRTAHQLMQSPRQAGVRPATTGCVRQGRRAA